MNTARTSWHQRIVRAMLTFMVSIILAEMVAPVTWGDPRFVSPSGTHQPPFDSWYTAATNIASAVAISTDGDAIVVDDGIYVIADTLVITNHLTLQSVRGPEYTIIDGGGLYRCLRLAHPGSIIEGFTIQNGYTSDGFSGAGVLSETGGIIRLCRIVNNTLEGGGGGGGIFLGIGGVLENSIVTSNVALGSYYGGGGVAMEFGGTVQNCIITHNVSYSPGTGGGGGLVCWEGGIVRSCVISFNTNYSGEAYGGGGICVVNTGKDTQPILIENCTIIQNEARGWTPGDGGRGGGVMNWGPCIILNTIVYSNLATVASFNNWYYSHEASDFIHPASIRRQMEV